MPVALKLDKAILPKLPHHLLNDVMEQIRIFVENIIISSGVHGSAVPVLRILCWQLSPSIGIPCRTILQIRHYPHPS